MLDQEKFFNTYKVQEAFEDSGLSWDTLEKIYDDYKSRLPEMKKMADHLQEEISKEIDFHVHSIHNRCKNPEHLIEKIIRKVGVEKRQKYKSINEKNYLRIVRDLMGVRILILSKEEWRTVHDFLLKVDEDPRYDICMAENIVFLEVLKNLDKLTQDTFFMSYSPLPIYGLDSCPIRAYAIEGLAEFAR